MLGNSFEIENKYGTLYVAFHGLKATNHESSWSTSYSSETVYIKLRDFVDFMQALGIEIDADKLAELAEAK